jgi:ABC-type transport system involved in multi-copper enzyme maturation permease subunit
MSNASALQPVMEGGGFSGFWNLLRKENSLWWSTRKWWVQGLIWLLISNGLIAFMIWIIPAVDPNAGSLPQGLEMLQVFIMMQGMFTAIGVAVLAQGLIVNEKRFGTAAWILSNPVSRSAFILSKLVGHGWSILIILIVFPSLVAYLQVSLRMQTFFDPVPFILGMVLVSLHMFFYFTLALMLGTLFNSTGPVIGISIGLLIGMNIARQILAGLVPWLAGMLPDNVAQMAGAVGIGQTLSAGWQAPILFTLILSLVFILAAIMRFRREEF